MARPIKKGLDYFPFDVDFFDDIKIRKLIKRQGGKAVSVYALLLCFIYKNGYYIGGDEELPFIISEKTGYDEVYIQEVIKSCISLGLFDKIMYEKNVLTSRGIQLRYEEISKLIKRKGDICEFSLINSEETPVNSEETPVNSEETPVNSEFSTQKKGKKNKLKEIKEKENKEISPDGDCRDEPRPQPKDDFINFISSFNAIRGTKFQAIDKVRKQFNARLKEGFTTEQMLQAYKSAIQNKHHIETNYQYLTPEFFTRSDKIDMYLNVTVNSHKSLDDKQAEFKQQLLNNFENGNK